MNPERISLLLDRYAAHFPSEGGVPAGLESLWQAAQSCAAAFDLHADDLQAMLREAFAAAAPVINYTGSVQPLHGLHCLAEHEPAALRQALGYLLADDKGDLSLRQAQMQAYSDRCSTLLKLHAPGKRSWDQNLRSAISFLAFLRPADNYLYKSTEARYLADMLGYTTDVSSGAHFSVAAYYAMCDELAAAISAHPVLGARLPADAALPANALLHLMTADLILSAGEKKLALLKDTEPLIRSRSRAGQATQERALQISVLQLELEGKQQTLQDIARKLAELVTPELTGQRVHSPSFGEATIQRVQGSILFLDTTSGQRRLSQPACFLQGHLIPEDPALARHIDTQRRLLDQQKELQADMINLQCAISRLQLKP